MARLRTRFSLAAAVTALTLAAAGCSGGSSGGETPDEAAAALAHHLASGRLAGADLRGADGAQRWWKDAVAGLHGSRHTVTVAGVGTGKDDAHATARLRYRWQLAGTGTTWSYTTTAALVRGDAGHWAATWSPHLLAPTLARGDRLVLESRTAPRADILGAGGVALVKDRPVVRYGIDKTLVSAAGAVASAKRAARLLDVDPSAFAARVKAAGDKAFVEAIVLRRSDVSHVLPRSYPKIPGFVGVPDTMSLAPTREFARPILGTVGPVTAEIVKASRGAYRAGDEAGLSGLEQRYDEQLRGTPGVTVVAVPRTGDPRTLFATEPRRGKPLRTTLDPRLQATAERALAGVGPASALVAIRPSDGHVLVAASGPGSDGYSTATVGRYAPGSTFKVVSSLALLRKGLTPDSIVPCTSTIVVDGKTFKNYSDYPSAGVGRIPLRTAVADSCNTAFVSQHDRVSAADVADAAATLGLGVDHDLGFPVFLGSVPAGGTTTEHAASLIGQGKVLASPMAMAAVAASVASGRTVVPDLLPGQQPSVAPPPRPLTGKEDRALRGLMRGVVTSGSGSFLAGLGGPPVLAKTGTAEFGDRTPPQTHAWMIGVHGDLAVAAFVDVGESGSHTAGPLLEQLLRAAS